METLAKPTVTIRRAQLTDIPLCVDMIALLRQETFWRNMPESCDLLAMNIFILNRLFTQSTFCLYVGEMEGKLIGLCGGELTTHFLAPHVSILTEWAWWVDPDYRHGTVGARLWLTVCQWAKGQGVRYASRNKVLSKDKIGHALGTESFTVMEL